MVGNNGQQAGQGVPWRSLFSPLLSSLSQGCCCGSSLSLLAAALSVGLSASPLSLTAPATTLKVAPNPWLQNVLRARKRAHIKRYLDASSNALPPSSQHVQERASHRQRMTWGSSQPSDRSLALLLCCSIVCHQVLLFKAEPE